jgi:hypothetical protein
VAGSCEHGIEVRRWEILQQLNDWRLLEDSVHGFSYIGETEEIGPTASLCTSMFKMLWNGTCHSFCL